MSLFRRSPAQPTDQIAAATGSPARTVQLTKRSAPAVSRDEVERTGGVDLAKKFDKAGVSLSKRGLDGIRAQAVMLLDHSGSMDADYRSGTVQQLVERALGFALQIDADGTIPVVRFDSRVWDAHDVDMHNYRDVASRVLYQRNQMGSTNLTAALRTLINHARTADAPIFAIVITDGEPDDRRSATAAVVELAGYPVFLKFLAIRPVSYLQELDDMDGRLIDNADAKYIADPSGMTDLAFADAMADEWDTWIAAAQAARILS